jgi:hypothetical protein
MRYISNVKSIHGSACQNACHPIWIGLGIQNQPRMGLVLKQSSSWGLVLESLKASHLTDVCSPPPCCPPPHPLATPIHIPIPILPLPPFPMLPSIPPLPILPLPILPLPILPLPILPLPIPPLPILLPPLPMFPTLIPMFPVPIFPTCPHVPHLSPYSPPVPMFPTCPHVPLSQIPLLMFPFSCSPSHVPHPNAPLPHVPLHHVTHPHPHVPLPHIPFPMLPTLLRFAKHCPTWTLIMWMQPLMTQLWSSDTRYSNTRSPLYVRRRRSTSTSIDK